MMVQIQPKFLLLHLTETPLDSVYSGVVKMRGISILLFHAKLSDLKTWTTDVGNEY